MDTRDQADTEFKNCPKPCEDHRDRVAVINSLDEDADSQRNVAAGAFIAGGVGLATGITLLILDLSSDKRKTSSASVQPLVGLGFAGVQGSF